MEGEKKMADKEIGVSSPMYPKLLQVIELDALATMTAEDISAVVGVPVPTISKWRRSDIYRSTLTDISVKLFTAMVPQAIKTIQDILNDPNARPKVKLDAAKLILDKTMPDLQQVDERSLQAIKVTVSYE